MTDNDTRELKRRIERLSTERIELFASTTSSTAPATERVRLKAIERELDECYTALRVQRAASDANRFASELPVRRPRPPNL